MNDIRALGVNESSDQPVLTRPESRRETVARLTAQANAPGAPGAPAVRTDLINAIRARIAAGEYDSADRVELAAELMIRDVLE